MRLPIPLGTGSASPAVGYDATVLADTPVGYWPCNESSGTIAHDLSGNGNDGTLSGSFSLGSTGIGDGETLANFTGGKMAVPDAAPLRLGSGAFTVEGWINLSSFGGGYSSLFDNTSRSYSLFLNDAGSANAVFLGIGGGSTGHQILGTGNIATGALDYIVFSFTPNTGKVYVNAVPSVFSVTPGGVNSSTGVTFFGNPSTGGSIPQGIGGKFAVYNYRLSDAQVTAHYAAA